MDHLSAVLLQLFVLLLAAKTGDELFKRLGLPALVGEILGGLLVGPSVLGWYALGPETQLFAEIGVVLLLFQVGLGIRLNDLLRVGSTATMVAMLGVVLPLAGGIGLGLVLGHPLGVAVFLGAALTATSVGVTARVLQQLGLMSSDVGRILIGAAIIDDVLAMLILAVATGLAGDGIDVLQTGVTALVALAFIGLVGFGGTRLLRRHRSLLTEPRFADTPFLPGMLLMLGLAAASASIGLAAIIGAFLAGLVTGESSERHALELEVAPVAAFFTPFFFGAIGAQVQLGILGDPAVLGVAALVTLLAIGTKLLGAFAGALRLGVRRAAIVGVGMVPRGEVGIVVAGLGLQLGTIDGGLYAAVVTMCVATTLLVPPLLPYVVRTEAET
jgi:Kef-type K+ transport system membrane component KefB